ncbi:MAG: hypothetical protein WDO13_19835 [Verrucomicrobiota bacterium]
MEMTAEYLTLLESRAKIKLNEIRENKMDDQDRMDFSDYIKTLYKGHRYYHVIIAGRLLPRALQRGRLSAGRHQPGRGRRGEQWPHRGRRSAPDGQDPRRQQRRHQRRQPGRAGHRRQPFNAPGAGGDTEQPLSIADEVTSALEINERVSQAIEVFPLQGRQGRDRLRRRSSSRKPSSANEFHPALQGLPRDEKEKWATS